MLKITNFVELVTLPDQVIVIPVSPVPASLLPPLDNLIKFTVAGNTDVISLSTAAEAAEWLLKNPKYFGQMEGTASSVKTMLHTYATNLSVNATAAFDEICDWIIAMENKYVYPNLIMEALNNAENRESALLFLDEVEGKTEEAVLKLFQTLAELTNYVVAEVVATPEAVAEAPAEVVVIAEVVATPEAPVEVPAIPEVVVIAQVDAVTAQVVAEVVAEVVVIAEAEVVAEAPSIETLPVAVPVITSVAATKRDALVVATGILKALETAHVALAEAVGGVRDFLETINGIEETIVVENDDAETILVEPIVVK